VLVVGWQNSEMGILCNPRCNKWRWTATLATTKWKNSCTKKIKDAQCNVRFLIFHFLFLFFRSKSNVIAWKKENRKNFYWGQPFLGVYFWWNSLGMQINIWILWQDWLTNAIFFDPSLPFAYFARFSFIWLFSSRHWYRLNKNCCSICFNDTNDQCAT